MAVFGWGEHAAFSNAAFALLCELRLLMWTVGRVLAVYRHSENTRDRESYRLVRYTAILQ